MLTCCMLRTAAQPSTEKQRAVALLRSVGEHYRSYKGLHFSVQYRYADERKPGIYLDSLKGDFTISGDRYRYSLDSTEFISGKTMSVILFKQDQLMYLARGDSAVQRGNPMALLDSVVLKNDSLDCRIQETKDWQTIILSFHPARKTKRVEYTIDRHTGFLTKAITVVSARELYDVSVRQKVEDDNTYAIVETVFGDYRATDPLGEEWDLNRLFKKEGREYIPLPPYETYKIVLGSPDL